MSMSSNSKYIRVPFTIQEVKASNMVNQNAVWAVVKLQEKMRNVDEIATICKRLLQNSKDSRPPPVWIISSGALVMSSDHLSGSLESVFFLDIPSFIFIYFYILYIYIFLFILSFFILYFYLFYI